PIWEARSPGDVRLLALLQVARRYAVGDATEDERRAASRLAVMACRTSEARRTDQWHDPAYAAGNAVGFCLWRPAGESLRQAAWWTAEAYRADHHYMYTLEGAQRLLGGLEARLG
ncbi:MAG TPA: hypothetical protein VNL71_19845, partial [Chloroflexota bacterium]|nr:hypothetical protein [Chloroflexota bacterium]